MSTSLIFNILMILIAIAMMYLLRHPRLWLSHAWPATLTPLSSIIGSGFLVIAPLLASIIGIFSPVAVIGIVILAYTTGSVIRFNIRHLEPRLRDGSLSRLTQETELLANIALCMAYVVAVAFYLSLLSTFLLNFIGHVNPVFERILTTIVIIFIAVTGYRKGLGGLEKLEALSMTVQLSIVAALMIGLVIHNLNFTLSGKEMEFVYPERDLMTKIRMLAGVLLVVQGFETSRFLGNTYPPALRIVTMRRAQLISGAIYIISVIALMPIVQTLDLEHIHLADIVQATAMAAIVFPIMLIVAAMMSQFSAAVADIAGSGGLLHDNSDNKLTTHTSYMAVSASAIVLVWAADLLQIISLASRAFALYYFLQTLLALNFIRIDSRSKPGHYVWSRIIFTCLAFILGFIVIFAIPAE